MIITKTQGNTNSPALISTDLSKKSVSISQKYAPQMLSKIKWFRLIQQKLKSYFSYKKNNTSNQIQQPYEELLQDHLSNTLGIIDLMSEEGISKGQVEHLASLKSSCDNLVKELQLPLKSEAPQSVKPKVNLVRNWNSKPKAPKGKILLICSQPLQKKIIKNLLQNCGYQMQVLSALPEDISLLSALEIDLIIIANSEQNLSETAITLLQKFNLDFLALSKFMSNRKRKQQKYPLIQGPIDPDFLKYKVNKLIQQKRILEAAV